MGTGSEKELRLNILVTPEGNGVLHRTLSQIEHPKRRAKHLLHLALTGLYAEAFLHASPTVLAAGVEGQSGAFRDSPSHRETVSVPVVRSVAPVVSTVENTKPDGPVRSQRAGLDLVDTSDMG